MAKHLQHQGQNLTPTQHRAQWFTMFNVQHEWSKNHDPPQLMYKRKATCYGTMLRKLPVLTIQISSSCGPQRNCCFLVATSKRRAMAQHTHLVHGVFVVQVASFLCCCQIPNFWGTWRPPFFFRHLGMVQNGWPQNWLVAFFLWYMTSRIAPSQQFRPSFSHGDSPHQRTPNWTHAVHKKKGTGPVAVQKRSHRFGNGLNGTPTNCSYDMGMGHFFVENNGIPYHITAKSWRKNESWGFRSTLLKDMLSQHVYI